MLDPLTLSTARNVRRGTSVVRSKVSDGLHEPLSTLAGLQSSRLATLCNCKSYVLRRARKPMGKHDKNVSSTLKDVGMGLDPGQRPRPSYPSRSACVPHNLFVMNQKRIRSR